MPHDVVPGSSNSELPKGGPIPYVDLIIGAMGQFNIAFPIAFELTRNIIALFRSRNPDIPLPTDAEVIERLKQRALEDRAENEQWLRERGYIQ